MLLHLHFYGDFDEGTHSSYEIAWLPNCPMDDIEEREYVRSVFKKAFTEVYGTEVGVEFDGERDARIIEQEKEMEQLELLLDKLEMGGDG